MKILGIIWNVIVNIITVIIVGIVLSVPSTQFESVITAAVVMVFLSITGFIGKWQMRQLQLAECLNNDFEEVKRLLNNWENIEDYTDEYLQEVKQERAEAKKKAIIQMRVYSVFQFILFLITFIYLVVAVAQ